MSDDGMTRAMTPTAEADDPGLTERYEDIRSFTEALCEPLATEDYVVQTMRDVSPTKWHLAHVTWFFETFILRPHAPGYEPLNPAYAYLFNSYYLQAGERHCRDQRGYISRPTVEEVYEYRAYVDDHLLELLAGADGTQADVLAPLVEIGLQHEQQHQELLLTDIKHVLSVNPLRPAYWDRASPGLPEAPGLQWIHFDEGLHWVGHPLEADEFCYDNETPRHRHFLDEFLLGSRLVTNGEYLAFLEDGGYERGDLWLSEGWATVREAGWSEPFYWEKRDGRWWTFTLSGMREVHEQDPVCHLSYFEADAYARWAGARLPTEAEWEVAAATARIQGNFVEEGRFHPVVAGSESTDSPSVGNAVENGSRPSASTGEPELLQMYGDVWEWTRSQYSPYPGYEPLPGALGEYNGKFMSNQFVLRGGSCATSITHIRPTYRNFFPADATWQFMGVRLARDVK
jgi:ergothioneine biosynthesis protein EgtB